MGHALATIFDCGCEIVHEGLSYRLNYCRVHAEAPAMLEALQAVGKDIAMTAPEDHYVEITPTTEKMIAAILARIEKGHV